MTEKQVINSGTENALKHLAELRAKLEKAIKDGAEVDVQIDFKRQIKAEKVELKDRKCRIKDKVKLAKCKYHIQKIEAKLVKAKNAEKPDQKKIERINKRREWWIMKQEQARLAEEKRLAKRVQCYKSDQAKIQDKVQFCTHHPKAKGCDAILQRYRKDAKIVVQAKTNKRNIDAKIVKSRESHIKTFENNKDIEAKKVLIVHRYNVKVERAEKRIQKLENRLRELSGRADSERLRNTEKRVTQRIERLQNSIKKLRLEQDKTLVIKSTGPGQCSTCEQKILELLNKIYSNVVTVVTKTRRVKKTRVVKKPHTWTTQEKRFVTKRVLKHFKVKKIRNVQKTEYVTREKKWTTMEPVKKTLQRWVDHKVLKNKVRDVKKKVAFENWRWVTKKVLVQKPRKFRNQELIELPGGKFEWKDLGFETRMVPVWEDQRVYEKFQDTKEVIEKQPYQEWVTEKKQEPYTVTEMIKKEHSAFEKVPVQKTVQVEETVDEPRWVDEKVEETYTKTHHGHKDHKEEYEEDEKYTEEIRKQYPERRQEERKQAAPAKIDTHPYAKTNSADTERAEAKKRAEAEREAHRRRKAAEENTRVQNSRKAEEDKRRQEEETRRAHSQRVAAENARKQQEEHHKRVHAENTRRQQEEHARRVAAEHARKQQEEHARRVAAEHARKQQEEHHKRLHAQRVAAEQAQRAAAEHARRQHEEHQHRLRAHQAHQERLRSEEEARRRANPFHVVSQQRVAIQSAYHGTYFRAHPGHNYARVDTQIWAHGWETWTMLTLASGKVAFRSYHGTYLRAYPGGTGAKLDTANQLNAWETFDIVRNHDGTVSLRSVHGNFIRVFPGRTGAHIDMQTAIGGWERLRLVNL